MKGVVNINTSPPTGHGHKTYRGSQPPPFETSGFNPLFGNSVPHHYVASSIARIGAQIPAILIPAAFPICGFSNSEGAECRDEPRVPWCAVSRFWRSNARCGSHPRCTSHGNMRWFRHQLSLSRLKACVHSLRKKPGIHHNMHSGSIARAASALPISAVSHPN